MKTKILGYAVVSEAYPHPSSGIMQLGNNGTEEEKLVLWFGAYGTVFKTRRQASQSILRTKKYADKNEHLWPWVDGFRVKTLRAA